MMMSMIGARRDCGLCSQAGRLSVTALATLAALLVCIGPIGCAQFSQAFALADDVQRMREALRTLDHVMDSLVLAGAVAGSQADDLRAGARSALRDARLHGASADAAEAETTARATAQQVWLNADPDARAQAAAMLGDANAGGRLGDELQVVMSVAQDKDAGQAQKGEKAEKGEPDRNTEAEDAVLLVLAILLAVFTLVVIILAIAA